MATQNELIYNIKNLRYSGLGSDDSIISDDQILFWINTERAALIKEETEKKKRERSFTLSDSWRQDLGCIEVECVDLVDCCNIECKSGEYAYRTVRKIPKPLYVNWAGALSNGLLTYVGLITKMHPFEFTSHSMVVWSKYKKYTSQKIRSFYLDGYVYLVNVRNPDTMDYISIIGVFEDPTKAETFTTCEGEPCFTEDMDYPIPSHLISPMTQRILAAYLQPTYQPAQDTSNDTLDKNQLQLKGQG